MKIVSYVIKSTFSFRFDFLKFHQSILKSLAQKYMKFLLEIFDNK